MSDTFNSRYKGTTRHVGVGDWVILPDGLRGKVLRADPHDETRCVIRVDKSGREITERCDSLKYVGNPSHAIVIPFRGKDFTSPPPSNPTPYEQIAKLQAQIENLQARLNAKSKGCGGGGGGCTIMGGRRRRSTRRRSTRRR